MMQRSKAKDENGYTLAEEVHVDVDFEVQVALEIVETIVDWTDNKFLQIPAIRREWLLMVCARLILVMCIIIIDSCSLR